MIRRVFLFSGLIVIYLFMDYYVYTGPLSLMLPAKYPVVRDMLWNYGLLAFIVLLLWFVSKFLPKREIPRLPTNWTRFIILLFAIALNVFFLVSFWKWLVENPPKSISYFIVEMGNALPRYVSSSAANRILNAVLAVYETLFVFVIVLWQLRGWRRQTFSFTWRNGIATGILIAISSTASLITNRAFLHNDSLQVVIPSGGFFNVVIMFFSQSLVNGIPEELFYRAYIFPQLLAWLRQPLLTGWIMVIIFNASHIPSLLIGQGVVLPWWKWILWCLFNLQPSGWLFFAIYYYMRSAIPGAIYHTYTTLWAFPFLP